MKNYDTYLDLLNQAEKLVERRERQLRSAELQLRETLELVEALFQNDTECVIEVKEDGKWKMVGYDKDSKCGWSTNPTRAYKTFKNIEKARESGIYKQLQDNSDLIEGQDYRINNTDGPDHF